ncbi:hypothetical protein GN958_ATG02348, partial [Phytophthora infestans]
DCKVQMMTPLWILSETKPISVYGPPRFVCSGLNFRLNFCSALLGVRQAAAKHRRSIEDILITQLAETADPDSHFCRSHGCPSWTKRKGHREEDDSKGSKATGAERRPSLSGASLHSPAPQFRHRFEESIQLICAPIKRGSLYQPSLFWPARCTFPSLTPSCVDCAVRKNSEDRRLSPT